MLNIFLEEVSDTTVLHCIGSLVLGDETTLLCRAIHEAGKNVILDMSLVDRIDAAGIGALVALQAAGIYLTIADPSKAVADVLRLTHVDSLFEVIHGSASQGASGQDHAADRSFHSPVSATA